MKLKELSNAEIRHINIAGLSDRQLRELMTELLVRLVCKDKKKGKE
jgi:hypothetical protein